MLDAHLVIFLLFFIFLKLLSTINNLQGICDVSLPASPGTTMRGVSALSSSDSAASGRVRDMCVEVVPLQGSGIPESSNQSKRQAPSAGSEEEQVKFPFVYDFSQQHGGMEARGNDHTRVSNGLHKVFGDTSNEGKGMPKGGTKRVETASRGETKSLHRDAIVSSKGDVPAAGMKREAGVVKSKGLPLNTSGNAKRRVLISKNVKEAVGTAEKTSWKPVKTQYAFVGVSLVTEYFCTTERIINHK